MMRGWMAAIWVCGCVTWTSAGEAPARRYDLAACLRMGLKSSATAANARRDVAIAEAQAKQARSEALPQLSLSAGYTRLDELQTIDLGGEEVDMGTLDNYSAQADVKQLLYSSGRVTAALRAADAAEELSRWTRLETEARLARDIRMAFYDILLAREAIRAREASVAQMEGLVRQTEEKMRHGASSEFESLSAQARLSGERPGLILATNVYAVGMETFRRLVGLGPEPFELEGDLAAPTERFEAAEWERRAMLNRPGLRAMEATVRLYREDVEAARGMGKPNIRAFFTYAGANSYRFVTFDDEWQWHWNAGVTLDWNFWDGGLTGNRVRQKEWEWEKIRSDCEEMAKTVRLEVRKACLDIEYATATARAAADGVRLAERAQKIAQTRHEAGLATYLEYVDAVTALKTARLAHWAALRDYLCAVARLMFESGWDREFEKEENGR